VKVWAVLVTDYSDDSFRELYIFETYDKADEYVKINWHKWEDNPMFNYEIYEREVK
jgi:hypothetical protein